MSTDLEDIVGLTDAEIDSLGETETETLTEEDKETIAEEADATAGTEEIKAIQDQFVPEYKPQNIDGLDDNYKQLDAAYTELSDKLAGQYEDGELSFTEYRKESRELDHKFAAEKSILDTAKLKADIAQEQAQQITEQRWQWEQDTFFKDNKEFKDDPVLYGALDATLRAAHQDQANNGKSGLQLLRESADKVRSRFDGAKRITSPDDQKKISASKSRPELPVTLANIPAADSNVESAEFDYMDKLSGMAYEAAIAKMSDDQRARFLA